MDHGQFSLSELLLNDGISRVSLCKRALSKAVKFLSSDTTTLESSQESIRIKAESIHQCLQTLTVLLKGVEPPDSVEVGSSCFHEVCVPYLRWLSREQHLIDQPLFATALKTVALALSCLMEEDNELQKKIVSWFNDVIRGELCCQRSFQSDQQGDISAPAVSTTDQMSSSVALPVLQLMLESFKIKKCTDPFQELFEPLLKFVTICDTGMHFFLISSSLLPLFIANGQPERLEMIWELVKSVHSNKITVELNSLEVTLTLLCCLHDVFISQDLSSPFSSAYPPDLFELTNGRALLDLRKEDSFWSIVQDGLTSPDPLSRKRCMYLLHCVLVSVQRSGEETVSSAKCVFWWDTANAKQLLAVWNDLVLVLETLEEKQVHIVKPVKKHLQNLITATRRYINGHSLLHVSWLVVSLSRIFVHHEAKSIIRWGVQQTLDMPLNNSPFLQSQHWPFMFGPLLEVLNETSLYGRDVNAQSDSCPPIAESLCRFLSRFISELPCPSQASSFMTQFISSWYSIKFADIPLVFISFALSKLPPQPLLRPEALAGIRSILLNCLLTHKPSLRAAIQCFLLTAVCNLTDTLRVGCVDVVQTLGCFRSNGCLLYNSSPWRQASQFLTEFCKVTRTTTQSSARTQTADSAAGDVMKGGGANHSLFSFLSECVTNCTREEKDQRLPGEQQVARVMLLAVHAETTTSTKILSTTELSLFESLTQLVAPFMDLLAGAHTRLYLSHSSVLSSLELLTSLLDQWLLGQPHSREEVTEQAQRLPAPDAEEEPVIGRLLYKTLLPWLPDIMVYVQDRLLQKESQIDADLHLTGLYSSALDRLYRFMNYFGFSFEGSRDIGPKCVAKRAMDCLRTVCSYQTVQVTPPFLGAVTALSWVCTLPTMMSSVTPPTCNDDIITMATTGDMQSPLLTQQNLSGCHGDQFELATSISRLPLNLVVVKPVLPAAEGGRSLTGGVVETDEEEGKGYFGVTASKRKTEWGPLITHCYTCYWKCVLFSLQRLHPRPISSEKMGGASLMLSQSSDIIDTPFSSPSTLSDPAKNLSGIISSVGAKGPAVPIGSNDMNVIIEVCLGSLDLLDEGLSSAIDSLTALLPEILETLDPLSTVVSCARTIWPFVLEQLDKHNRSFRRALKSFVEFTFHSSTVLRCREDEPFCVVMQQEYIRELFELGEAKSGVFNVLVAHVLDTWTQHLLDTSQTVRCGSSTGTSLDSPCSTSPGDLPGKKAAAVTESVIVSMKAHCDFLIKSALFGPVHKKNVRLVEEVEGFIESAAALGTGTDAVAHSLLSSSQADKSVRVCVVNFLVKLISICEMPTTEQRKINLLDDFLHHLAASLTKELARISLEKPKYYINSATHRTKLRLLQCLIVATTRINKTTAGLVAEQLLSALQFDNQLSVRYLIEWQTVLLLCSYPELIDDLLLPCLTFDTEKRLSRMCSIFTIAMHVGLCLNKTNKESYYLRVFPLVYQWTSSYHFIVRLYSQRAVFRMWAEFASIPSLSKHFRMMEGLVSFMKQTGDGSKFQHKMKDNIFFTTIKADADVSIEALFHTLPCLCRVTDEELIPPELFETLGMELWRTGMKPGQDTDFNNNRRLKLRCENQELLSALAELRGSPLTEECGSDTKSISHHLKSSTSGGESLDRQPVDTAALSSVGGEGDVQKKITPWSNPGSVIVELFPKSGDLTTHHFPRSQRNGGGEGEGGREEGGLVLVASLLNKIPNLGGLARTCEIFGVSELVLSNAKILEEKQFQSLSVTAEKWLTITEVKLPALQDYLLSMRRKGYALVGAEQTANSRDIINFTFKPNTVLVLGNEREGIPVPIIHLLDSCVEIPQFGMVRSLNAHVSGALLVWEYVKQHFVHKDSKTTPITPPSSTKS